MELEDLKETWKKTAHLQTPQNNDIMELIRHKTYGPLHSLKKSFKRQVILLPLFAAIIINNLSRNHAIFTDVMFWCFIAFWLALCVFFYLNYRMVSKMAFLDSEIKTTLEQQVTVLEKRLQWHIIAVRVMLIFFIVLSEVITYFAYEPMLEKWHTVSPFLRLLTYAGLITFQYFASRAVSQRRYGQHLAYLKTLLAELK